MQCSIGAELHCVGVLEADGGINVTVKALEADLFKPQSAQIRKSGSWPDLFL